jgi:hypothetical protein
LVIGCLARSRGQRREAERVVAAAGWLRAWGYDAQVLLPGWLAADEREVLLELAAERGAAGAVAFVGPRGADRLSSMLRTAEVMVHLGSGPEAPTPEDALAAAAGCAVVTTAQPPGGTHAPAVTIPTAATPLLLAEAVLGVVPAAPHARPGPTPPPRAPLLDGWRQRLVETLVDGR